jgi:CHAD domain-containing protein
MKRLVDAPAAREPADRAARAILRALLDRLFALAARVAAAGGASELHALRVTLRRMRSVARELARVLPATESSELATTLTGLARRTSPVRDIDVVLLAFEGYADAIPEPYRAHLAPVRRHLEAARERAFRHLCAELTEPKLRELEAIFARFERANVDRESVPSLEAVVTKRARRLAKRIRRRGRHAGLGSEIAELHGLRKDVKRLRYLLEIFRGAFARDARRELLRDLNDLQDLLGGIQDRDVHRRLLEEAIDAGPAEAVPRTYAAVGRMLEHLGRAQESALRALPAAFHRFDRPKARKHAHALGR